MTDGHGPYQIMPTPVLAIGSLQISALQPAQIETVRVWRNAQMDVLRQSHAISPKQQIHYFQTQIWPDKTSNTPKQILLAIHEGGQLIGYGGLVHISWEHRRAEISFLLAPKLESKADKLVEVFLNFLQAVKQLAFKDLSLNRLSTETYAHRHRHIATLEAAGLQCEGRLREHVLIDGNYVDSLMHAIIRNDP